MRDPRLILFARYPEPGKAKTRLIPEIGEKGAADVHRKLTEQTLDVMRKTGLPIEIRTTGASALEFATWLGDDICIVDQGKGDLGDRLTAAIGETPVIIVGADCPDLRPEHLNEAAAALTNHQVVIGPAEDGGYWLIGLAAELDWLFTDIDWGTDRVLPETLKRLDRMGISTQRLEVLADCDRPEDLGRWPWLTA